MTTPRYASGTNLFVPEPSGLAIAYVRDPDKFKFNQYAQLMRADVPTILYAVIDPDTAVRVVTDQEYAWPDGQKRPEPTGNLPAFRWEEVGVERRNYGYTVGEQLVQTAKGFVPKALYDAHMVSIAGTNVTQRFCALMENTANWGGNTASVATLSGVPGATWDSASDDEGSPYFLIIKRSITKALRYIHMASNGVVGVKDLVLVISPDLAMAVANTAELHHYLGQSRFAKEQVEGLVDNPNYLWGLPSHLYGVKVVVEDAVRVTVRAKDDGTVAVLDSGKVFCKSRTSAVIVARPGSVDGTYGSKSFSTLQRYVYLYEMAVESRHDSWNKLYENAVVDQFKEVLAAPQTGYLLTSCMA